MKKGQMVRFKDLTGKELQGIVVFRNEKGQLVIKVGENKIYGRREKDVQLI